MPLQNLEQYKTFYYIAKLSSITAAAGALFVSQSAVSQSLKALETEIGCKLFERLSKGVRLTPEGKLLYHYVSLGWENLMEGEKKLKEMIDGESGEIKIGASDMTLRFYLLEQIEKFKKKYPKIKINVTNAPTPDTLKQLKEGTIDFGAVSSPLSKKADINIYPVKHIREIFIAGEKFIELRDRIVSLKELSQYPIVCLEKNTSTRKAIDLFMAENGVLLEPDFEISTSDLIVNFAERNMGIGVVMEDFAKQSISSGKVFRLQLEKEMTPRNICIITGKNSGISIAGQRFLDMII